MIEVLHAMARGKKLSHETAIRTRGDTWGVNNLLIKLDMLDKDWGKHRGLCFDE